jgi:hypothetical protein
MKYTEIANAFKSLDKLGYINYGTLIPTEVMEKIIGEKFSNDWNFLGPLLAIRQHIEGHGYLCTQRGIEDGSLMLVGTEDFAFHATRNFNKAMERMKRLQNCMINAKMNEFDSKDFKQYLHASNKINSGLNALNSVLNQI